MKIRRVFRIIFYCITALLFWSLEQARHYSAVTKIPCAPLKNSTNLTKFGELEFSGQKVWGGGGGGPEQRWGGSRGFESYNFQLPLGGGSPYSFK